MLYKNRILIKYLAAATLCSINYNAVSAITNPSVQNLRPKAYVTPKSTQNLDYLINKIQNFIDNEEYSKAMVELNQLMAKGINDVRIYNLSSVLLMKNNQFEEAEKMALKAIQVDYKNSSTYYLLGKIYFENAKNMGDSEEAVSLQRTFLTKSFDNFFMAIQYDPSNALPHIGLAEAYYANGQKNRAKDEILKAKELTINNAESYYALGEYYYKINDFNRSEKYLIKSINTGLNNKFKTYYLLANIQEQKGNIKGAQKNYINALKIKPDYISAQKKLDGLIKTSYKSIQGKKNTTKDLFTNINEELSILMKAEYYIVLDELTKARDLLIKLLEKNPKNINASVALAELYYSKWADGFTHSVNFTQDSLYIINTEKNKRSNIALLKYKLINKQSMPEEVRRGLINISVSETFDFYDLTNEVRAEFLLGNFAESQEKLNKLLGLNLSNFEKFKLLKYLAYDHNYYEALMVLKELQKTYYHNEEINPIESRILTKLNSADERLQEGIALFEQEDYKNAIFIYKEIIKYFPAYKPAYLHYAYTLAELENYQEALDKLSVYLDLYSLYPDEEPEISDEDLKELIEKYQKEMNKLNSK